MRYLALFFFLFTTTLTSAQQFKAIALELETLYDNAERLYTLQEEALLNNTATLANLEKEIDAFDSVALLKVKQIIYDYGWLGISEVGKKANKALFFIIQHAGDSATRALYYPQLEISVKMKESDPADMARMKDLLLVEAGKSQLYGTQYQIIQGERVVYEMSSPADVNKRRKKVGLKKLQK